MATHNEDIIKALSKRIISLDNGQLAKDTAPSHSSPKSDNIEGENKKLETKPKPEKKKEEKKKEEDEDF